MGKGNGIAIYVRVSTDGQTTVNQPRELETVTERHGRTVVEVFRDHAINGKNGREKRPGLDRLLAAVARKEVDMVARCSGCSTCSPSLNGRTSRGSRAA